MDFLSVRFLFVIPVRIQVVSSFGISTGLSTESTSNRPLFES